MEPEAPAIPQNTTPRGTVERFIWAYENRDAGAYSNLFAGNFKFEFSSDADPELVQQYLLGWLRGDEAIAARHLFEGGEDQLGQPVEAASSIELTLDEIDPVGDVSRGSGLHEIQDAVYRARASDHNCGISLLGRRRSQPCTAPLLPSAGRRSDWIGIGASERLDALVHLEMDRRIACSGWKEDDLGTYERFLSMKLRSRVLSLFLLLVGVGSLGCETETDITLPEEPGPPVNDTPAATIERFEWGYERQDEGLYGSVLTGDFRFAFSPQDDPAFANEFGDDWAKSDEVAAATTLFDGGQNRIGLTLTQAQTILLTLDDMAPVGDASAGRDSNLYKVLDTTLRLDVRSPTQVPIADIGRAMPNTHRMFLVRGDAADSLNAGQRADSTRWYIWKWQENSAIADDTLSTEPTLPNAPAVERSFTWGDLKGQYR